MVLSPWLIVTDAMPTIHATLVSTIDSKKQISSLAPCKFFFKFSVDNDYQILLVVKFMSPERNQTPGFMAFLIHTHMYVHEREIALGS